MIPPFQLLRPSTVDEALELAANLGDEARFYAGGTELLLAMREGFLDARYLIDLKRVSGLAGIASDEADGSIRIGAVTTHTDVERSSLIASIFPELARLVAHVANLRVRNTGTLGGNLCFAEPHGEPATLLIAADANVVLSARGGSRTVALADWIRGPFEADLRSGELLEEIRIPSPARRSHFAYRRLRVLERPTLGVGVRLDMSDDGDAVSDARIVVGCAGPRAERIPAADQELREARGSMIDAARAAADAASDAADIDGDAYGPEDYKRNLVRVLVQRAVMAALDAPAAHQRLNGEARHD
jgi:aerobic carbon-monoxide dehydrogenase medium subunit